MQRSSERTIDESKFFYTASAIFIVFIEKGQRRLVVQYPKRQVGNKMFGGDNSHLPLKLNTAGVIPPIFASSLLLMPITIANFSTGEGQGWLNTITAMLGRGQTLYMLLYAGLIIFFCYFVYEFWKYLYVSR